MHGGNAERTNTAFPLQPILVGERLTLRPLQADDWPALFKLSNDPLVWEQHPASDRWREDVFRTYFDANLASGGALVAQLNDTGEAIGSSRYCRDYVAANEIEIGWTMLGRRWWGGAWNGEMKALMLAHAFQHVDRVVLRIGAENWRSRKAAEKIGARPDGRIWPAGTDGLTADYVGYLVQCPD